MINTVFLFSCKTAVHDFPFLGLDSRRIELREHPGIQSGSEGELIATDDGYSTPLYKLKKQVVNLTGTKNVSFFIIYSANSEISIRFYFKNNQVAEKNLPVFFEETEFIFVPHGFDHFDSFRLFSDHDADLKVKCLGLIDETVGVELGSRMRIAEGYSYLMQKGGSTDHLIRFPDENGNFSLQLSYKTGKGFTAAQDDALYFTVGSADNAAEFRLTPVEKGENISLYRGMFPFTPRWIRFDIPDGRDIRLSSFNVQPLPAGPRTPLPADFQTILDIEPEYWRHAKYEIYSWNRFPEVLVFDFIDYQTQSRFLKRLAFFVEKKGYAGTVHGNDVIDNLHGWNAHDYRPSDMADFFNKAGTVDFDLNPEEIELRKILLENGIIRDKQGMYVPGKGAIISVSEESPYSLRKKLLTHEGSHGIVFVRTEYFEECRRVWETLTDDEKDFLRLFLAHNYYNINDRYLVVNEFQAYFVQQSLKSAGYFFTRWKGPELADRYPSRADLVDSVIRGKSARFEEIGAQIESILYKYSGYRLGKLSSLDKVVTEKE